MTLGGVGVGLGTTIKDAALVSSLASDLREDMNWVKAAQKINKVARHLNEDRRTQLINVSLNALWATVNGQYRRRVEGFF